MQIEYIDSNLDEEMDIAEIAKWYYPQVKLQKSDISRFIKKCIKDRNRSLLSQITTNFKIIAPGYHYYTFTDVLKFNTFLYPIDLDMVTYYNNGLHDMDKKTIEEDIKKIKSKKLTTEEIIWSSPFLEMTFFTAIDILNWFDLNEYAMSNHIINPSIKVLVGMISKELERLYPNMFNEDILEYYLTYNNIQFMSKYYCGGKKLCKQQIKK